MLTVLQQIIQDVSNASDFAAAVHILVKRTAGALATEACSVFLLNREHRDYVLVATHGLPQYAVGKLRVAVGTGLIGFIGEREETLNLDNAPEHPHFYTSPALDESAYRAFLGTPIMYQRQLLGVLVVQQASVRRYDEADEAFLATLATQFAPVVAHAEATGALRALFDRTPHHLTELVYTGASAVPGIGVGKGVVVHVPLDLDAVPDRKPENVDTEIAHLEHAFAVVREDLRVLGERLYASLPPEERALFEVYQRILDSAELGKEVADFIRAGNWAPGALRSAIQGHVRRLENLDNEYMRERADDIKDLGRRVLAVLYKKTRLKPIYSKRTILIGEAISPTDLAEVPEGYLAGVISVKGSPNSHVAILARALKVPTIMGVAELPIHALQGKNLIVDGHYGQVHVLPSKALRAEFFRLMREEKAWEATLEEGRDLPAVTKDGNQITLLVNTGLGADISLALAAGAEGVGLYRTEVPFLMRDRFPSTEEQRIIYRQLLTSFAPRPVIMRTLDIGGDKPLPYFPIKEDNPFLGWRGIRVTLDHPDIFLAQVRAMLRASVGLDNLRVMLPMITDVAEVDEALFLLRKSYAEVRSEGYDILMPQVGVMSAILTATAVNIGGAIGFVGLIIPHGVRLVLKTDDQRLVLPLSLLLGGTLLTVADVIARTLFAPTELPVGMVMTLIGVPVFIWLLLRS